MVINYSTYGIRSLGGGGGGEGRWYMYIFDNRRNRHNLYT